jgi:HK97 family phage portal protein
MELLGIEGPVTISGRPDDVSNDLRYGSIMLDPPPAAPGLYGLHSDPLSPWLADGLRMTPISFARIFATQPLVYRAVTRMLWWAIKVPLKVYQRDGEDRRELRPEDHPLAYSIHFPWERASRYNLVAAMLGSLLVHGNGTVQAHSAAGDRVRFEPRDWRYLKPLQVLRNTISGWESYEDSEDNPDVIPVQSMLHTAWYSPMGPAGISPLTSLGIVLGGDHAARRYTAQSMKNMARPPSAITVSNDFLGYEPEQRKAAIEWARAEVMRTTSGNNAGMPAVLPTGLEWSQVGHTAVEAELIDQRYLNFEDVAGAYMIPPPALGDLRRATYSNISELRQYAYTDSLGPPLILIEQAINVQLIHGLMGTDDVFVEHDFAGVLRGDKLAEMQALREAISIGLMSPNEGRAVINKPASDAPGADELYLPVNNLAPLAGASGAIQTARQGESE